MERTCRDCLVLGKIEDDLGEFKHEVAAGLSASPKTLPSRFFYDERGSELFAQITRLPEYYLTGCELEILRRSGAEILSFARGPDFNLVELGSGDGTKVIHLIDPALCLNRQLTYLPIDLSVSAMARLTDSLSDRYPTLDVRGIVGEYSAGLRWIKDNLTDPVMLLFLGSNLGNFERQAAELFLKSIRQTLAPGDLLVLGLDLRKDVETMLRAYNDTPGVTAEFNLNLLRRINRELNGNFDLGNFRYYSTFQPDTGGIDSYLLSVSPQSVRLGDLRRTFDFEEGEPIHTEHSHKYTESEIRRLAKSAGFVLEANFYDSRKYFVDSVWRVPD